MADSTVTLIAEMADCTSHDEPMRLILTTPEGVSSPPPAQDGLDSRGGHKHRRLATVGYIAPRFEGKEAQMAEGECS
jgi:hypothetical protein